MLLEVQSNSDCKEYCIIELQGEVHHEAGLKQGFCVGTLTALGEKEEGTVHLQIGYHRLEGKHVPLKNPIALLKRREAREDSDRRCPDFYVDGQIRSKYIFKDRPKALISQAS